MYIPRFTGGFCFKITGKFFVENISSNHLSNKPVVMADIEIKNKRGKHSPPKRSRKMIKVDLTPMVDLGFLLITFFVFTTTMAKATAMEIKTPYDAPPADAVCNSCALTVLLDKNNTLYYYAGAFENAAVKRADFKTIRNIIEQQKNALKSLPGSDSSFALIIKASDAASFRNFVDITDEVTINAVKKYYIDELTVAEKIKMAQ